MMRFLIASRWSVLFALPLLLAAGGCTYQLQGKVVEGPQSLVLVVDKDDPRFTQQPIPQATINVIIDHKRVNRKPLPTEVANPDGTFAVIVEEFGAGFLQYEALVNVQRLGFIPAQRSIDVPGPDKRVLVMLSPGRGGREPGFGYGRDGSDFDERNSDIRRDIDKHMPRD